MVLVIERDLQPLSYHDHLFNFADNNLLVPEHFDISMADEFKNVEQWAKKMIVNYLMM